MHIGGTGDMVAWYALGRWLLNWEHAEAGRPHGQTIPQGMHDAPLLVRCMTDLVTLQDGSGGGTPRSIGSQGGMHASASSSIEDKYGCMLPDSRHRGQPMLTLSSLSLTAALAGPISDRVVKPEAPRPSPGT